MTNIITYNNYLLSLFNGWDYKNVDDFAKDITSSQLHNYHEDWNKLIPLCRKFDTLSFDHKSININEEYLELSKILDNRIIVYEIMPVYMQLVDCVKWYYKMK